MSTDPLMAPLGDITSLTLAYTLLPLITANASNRDIIFLFLTCVLLLYVLCLHLLHEDIDASNVLIIFVSSKSYSIYFYAELS